MAIVCASSIDRVTIYARGAVVTRAIQLPEALPDGPAELALPGVTALAEPSSLRVALDGARQVLSVRAELVQPENQGAGPMPEQLRELRHRIDRLQGELAALDERRGRLLKLTPDAWPGAVGGFEARARQAMTAGKALDEALGKLDGRAFELEEALREAQRQQEALELSLRQSSAAREARPTRTLLLRLGGAGKVARAEVSYIVAPARWWPLYTLRVADGGRSATMSIEALVAQLSGEDWAAARLAFATADLVHDARLPELASLRLGRAQPPPRTGYRPPPPGLDQLFAAHDRHFPDLIPPKPIPEDSPEINYTLRDLLRGAAASVPTDARAQVTVARAEPIPDGDELEAELDEEPEQDRPRDKGKRAGNAPPPPPPAQLAAAVPQARSSTSIAKKAEDILAKRRQAPPAAPGGGGAPVGGDFFAAAQAKAGAADGVRGLRGPQGSHDEGAGVEPADRYLDFSRLRLGSAMERQRRGRLFQVADEARSLAAMQRIEAMLPPQPDVRDPRATRGQFAHRYEAAARSAVPSDGVAHLVPVASAPTPLRSTFRTIPSSAPEAYREAQFTNPFEAPLLSGPVQIYIDGSLLTTASLDRVGKGGVTRVGLGVEPRIRVARNTQVHEGASGLLNGSTVVTQAVRVELVSSLNYPAEIEVLERVPISDDKQINVERVGAKPEAQLYEQIERGEPLRGGLRWQLTLAPAGASVIEHHYRITLPAKYELSGGNRRD